jgi:hypothetical protein
MSDQLTPEEQAAFDRLPRERMPAGLEDRVVGQMRERGFLRGGRRTLVLTNRRVAGLLAACVALVIGAYSIGLQQGVEVPVLPVTEMSKPQGELRADRPVDLEMEGKTDAVSPGDAPQRLSKDEVDVAESVAQKKAKPAEREDVASSDAVRAPRSRPAANALEPSAPSSTSESPAAGMRALQRSELPPVVNRPYRFMLNGIAVTVEAPDSVRVVPDESGRTLLIYTSDGIFRFRLGNDD